MLGLLKRIAAPVAAVALLGLASAVQADTIQVSLVSHSGDTYTYEAEQVAAPGVKVRVETGDFFTIYDFAGYIAGSATDVGDWKFSTANDGPDGIYQGPTDNPSLPNLTWTYQGTGLAQVENGSLLLGQFSARTSYAGETLGLYSSQDHQYNGTAFALAGHTATVTVAAVPLPGIAWAGMGLFGLLGVNRLRKGRVSA